MKVIGTKDKVQVTKASILDNKKKHWNEELMVALYKCFKKWFKIWHWFSILNLHSRLYLLVMTLGFAWESQAVCLVITGEYVRYI